MTTSPLARDRAPHHVPLAAVQGTLALDLQPRTAPPRGPGPRTGTPGQVLPIDQRARREGEQWVGSFAQAVVEVVGGDRPASQLVRWTTRSVYEDLTRRAQLVARAGAHQPGLARVQPVRPQVLSVHTCFPCRDVLESSVHVRYGHRSRAVAARFERRAPAGAAGARTGERWLCTALQFA